jgi:2-polyprenyl-3-methyl-5-hydroxy-6-metoxy-1,4-benzoquinol methylase
VSTGADNFGDYDSFYLSDKEVSIETYQKRARGFGKKLSGWLAGSRDRKMLDIGCGVGYLLYFLQQEGFKDITGIDANEKLTQITAEKTKAKCIAGDGLKYLQNSTEIYDCMFLWNVIEHIPSDRIVDSLKILSSHLSKDGFVVIRTPNMTNVLGQAHLNTDFTHCTGFTEHSLEQVAQIAGFSTVEMLDQFKIQSFKGKIKAILNWCVHKWLLWLRGGAKSKVFYRNIYAVLRK